MTQKEYQRFLAQVQGRKQILAQRHPASDYDLTDSGQRRVFNDTQLCRLEYGDDGFCTWDIAKVRFRDEVDAVFHRFHDIGGSGHGGCTGELEIRNRKMQLTHSHGSTINDHFPRFDD
jgi:hypothetical protein